jgi:hypothetical protein
MGMRELKKELNALDKKELIEIITDLYSKAPLAKEMLDERYGFTNPVDVFQKYRKQIIDEFFPEKGFGKLRYANIRDAISKFRKISKDSGYMAELLFTHVKYGIDFTNEYGDIDERFYENIEEALERFLEFISENKLLEKYKDLCFAFIDETEGIGWGFHDEVENMVYEFYDDPEEN